MNRLRSCFKSISTVFLLAFLALNVFSLSNAAYADGTVLNTTVEYGPITEAAGFASSEPWNPVWHFGNSTYLVWVDAKQRAWVTQVTNGKSNTVPVDALTDYLVQADGHHRFSIGVDKAGYIHVTGDMHHYSNVTTAVLTPYPVRYQKQQILYWKSKLPNDISGGFVFSGGSNTATAIPGGGWLIGHFFADNNGELYYASQVHAFESGVSNNGQMAVGLYRYNVTTSTWTAIGAIAPKSDSTAYDVNPVFYWEDAGASGGWFQNYQASFKFDSKNRLHFAVTGNTNSKIAGANRILYAYSDDNGTTWKKANGTLIAGLPLRGIDGQANTADVVADSGAGNTYGATVGLAIDKNLKVGISVDSTWRVWDGKTWSTTSAQNYPNLPSPNMAYRMPDNSLVFQDANGTKILRSPDLDTAGIGYDYSAYKSFTAIDDYSVRTSGIIYGMALNADGTESVLKTVISPAPLGTDWAESDVDYLTTSFFSGNAGLLNNIVNMTSYGNSIEGTQDSLHYAYKKMSGDGTISARVTVAPNNYAYSGLMMRETLVTGAKHASSLVQPNPNGGIATFTYRAAINGGTIGVSTAGIKIPYWLRLVRAGNVFTSYGSADGVTWKQLGQQTIAMNTDIYVGMVGTAYHNHWFMEPASFDNVTSPTPAPTCTLSAPTVTLTPASQTGAAGAALNYTVTVVNQNSSACANATFNLASVLASGLTGSFNNTSVSIASQASATATLSVTSSKTAIGTLSVSAAATNAANTAMTASAVGNYVVSAPTCTHADPTLTLSPTTQSVMAGKKASYGLSLTNNDAAACAQSTFSLDATIPTGLTGSFTVDNLTLAPGATGTAKLRLASTRTTPVNSYATTVIATNTALSTYNKTATATLSVISACVLKPPTIAILPHSQKTSGLIPANYVVTVVNHDTTACPSRLFRYTATSTPYGVTTYMDPYNVYIDAGKASTSQLTLTPIKDLADGTYTITVTSQNGGSDSTKLVYKP